MTASVLFLHPLLQCLQVTVCAGPIVPTKKKCTGKPELKFWPPTDRLSDTLPVGDALQVLINAGQRDSEYLKGRRSSSRHSLPQETWWLLPGLLTPQMLQAPRLHYISICNVLQAVCVSLILTWVQLKSSRQHKTRNVAKILLASSESEKYFELSNNLKYLDEVWLQCRWHSDICRGQWAGARDQEWWRSSKDP